MNNFEYLKMVEKLERIGHAFSSERERLEIQILMEKYLQRDWYRFEEAARYIVSRRMEMERAGVVR